MKSLTRSPLALLTVGVLLGILLSFGWTYRHEEHMKLKHWIGAISVAVGLALAGGARAADVVNDTMVDTAGTNLTAHSPTGAALAGGAWTKLTPFSNSVIISPSGSIRGTAGSSNALYINAGSPASADYVVQMDFKVNSLITNNQIGIVARGQGTNGTYIEGYYDPSINKYQLIYNTGVGGNYVGTPGVNALTVGSTYTMRLTVQGTTLTLAAGPQGGSLSTQCVGSIVGAGDITALAAAGSAGVIFNNATTQTDTTGFAGTNFRAYAIVTGITPGTTSSAIVAPYANSVPRWNPAASNWSYSLTLSSSSGGNGSYTHQWGQATTSGAETNVTGATTATYTFTGLAPATAYYWKDSVNDTVPTGAALTTEFSYTTPPAPTSQIVHEGDSITAGYGQTTGKDLGTQTLTALGTAWASYDVAASGETLAVINSTETGQVDSLYSSAFASHILTIFAGTNDLATSSTVGIGATTYNTLKTYVAGRKAVGYRVIACTILDRNGGFSGGQTQAGFATEQSSFNGLLRSNWATFADGLWDGQANKLLSYTTGGTTYINGDLIHPADLGGTLEAAGLVQTVTRLLTSGGAATTTIRRRIQ